MVDFNIDIIHLNTAGLGDYMKLKKFSSIWKSRFIVKGSYSCKKFTVYKGMKRYGQTSLSVVMVLLYFPMASQMLEGSLLPFKRELSTRLEPSM